MEVEGLRLVSGVEGLDANIGIDEGWDERMAMRGMDDPSDR